MREAVKDPGRLRDIRKSILHILDYVGERSMEDFVSDTLRYHAVVYNLMIIGEAANMLTKDFRETHPQTPWRQITGMRNFLIHGYHQVENDIVWQVITDDLRPLLQQVEQYLQELTQ